MDWLLVPVAYFAGSLPWGIYIVKLTEGVDVRTVGSGKTGMTNVLRAAGKTAAVLVLLADAGKGIGMVVAARVVAEDPAIHAAVAAAVIVGHIWPVLASFRGGRGIAPGLGTVLALDPIATLVGVLVFAPVVALTRYVSLGSVLGVVAAIAAFAVSSFVYDLPVEYFLFVLACGSLVIAMHHDNIKRLLAGTERRIGKPAG